MSPAHLARLEANKRGLYVADFVSIVESLGEKAGNLLPNDLGEIAHLKPLIDRLMALDRAQIPRLTAILEAIILLMGDGTGTTTPPSRTRARAARASAEARPKKRT
jgi:hypothetical protein